MSTGVEKLGGGTTKTRNERDERDGTLYTRADAARKLGLNAAQINYREIRSGIKPGRDRRGRIVYTEAEVVKMARVVGRHLGADELDVDMAGAAFDAFAEGKTPVEIVRARLASPDQAEMLHGKYVRLSGGLVSSTSDVQRFEALLATGPGSVKSGTDLVEAVAAYVARTKNGKLAVQKTSTATPSAWTDLSLEKEPADPQPPPATAPSRDDADAPTEGEPT